MGVVEWLIFFAGEWFTDRDWLLEIGDVSTRVL
jgi:hypothetical protein